MRSSRYASSSTQVASSKGDLADTEATKADDEAYLEDLINTCKTKSSDFEAREKVRADEIEALSKAIEILSGGVAEKEAKYRLLQRASRATPSLAQLRAGRGEVPTQQRVAAFLTQKAALLDSR